MELKYSVEENTLQLIALMKEHGIRKVVVSPGNTNISFVGSIQNDPYFQLFSCVDERAAGYMACGLAEESGEAVALSCTGATAARNYPSALTEAYYRKLPILAITSSQPFGREGQLFPQYTDRRIQFNDIVTMSVQIPYPYSDEERWSNNVKINNAILQLSKDGGGPVHINIVTLYKTEFSVNVLPKERVINRYSIHQVLPEIKEPKVCIFVGSHKKFDTNLERLVDEFCGKYNGIVLCDHTSNYKGKYRVQGGLVAAQRNYYPICRQAKLVIHLGEISGAYYAFKDTVVWRVSPDGEVRDPFKLLSKVFQMDEEDFFEIYNKRVENSKENTYLDEWKREADKLNQELPELPLSSAWIAKNTASRLPENSVLHFGILNSLRSWNLFEVPNSVYTYSNVGGFGIDGAISTCLGASLFDPNKLYFLVLGDLATFYDLNALGNRHVGKNLRILVANNGTGYEMHSPGSIGNKFGNDVDKYMAAGGHFGKQSKNVLKHFAQDLGFEYICAQTKEEYLKQVDYFTSPKESNKPIIFEVFFSAENDKIAYNLTKNITKKDDTISNDFTSSAIGSVKRLAKNMLGDNIAKLKKF